MSSSSIKSGANLFTTSSGDSKSISKDEEICDDWEQLDQQKIEKSLQSIKINSSINNRLNEGKIYINENNQSSSNMAPMFINSQIPQPSIKILKRPESNKKLNEMVNQNSNVPSQPIKTFEQREQEYAQARLRILGSAHPEEEPSSIVQANNQTNNQTTNQSNLNKNNSNSNLSQSINKQNFNLTRDPVAPDGSKGFKNKNF